MFDSLSERLGLIFEQLTKRGALSEKDVSAALREARRALLEADVALEVVREFTDKVKEKAIGQEVLRSVTPGQMVIKIVHDELVEMLGKEAEPLDLETIEDDFDYTVEENLVLDPKIPVALVDLEAADSYAVERKNTVLNDVRRLFALNQDGGTVAIANYAPAMTFNTNALPLPAEEKAKTYGVQPSKLWQRRAMRPK